MLEEIVCSIHLRYFIRVGQQVLNIYFTEIT